jgi:hypothetical protein
MIAYKTSSWYNQPNFRKKRKYLFCVVYAGEVFLRSEKKNWRMRG